MAENGRIKDSGGRRRFATGAVRDRAVGKGRFDLLPFYALEAVAIHYEHGGKKYKMRNWEVGIPLRCYLDSAGRHIAHAVSGHTDEPHVVAALWNLMGFLHTKKMVELGALPKSLLTDMPTDLNIDDPESVRTYQKRLRKAVESSKVYIGKAKPTS